MSSSSSDKKMITLRSAENEIFEVEEAVALQSETIKHLFEEDCATGAIPLSNVTAPVLSKVIEYCKKHADHGIDLWEIDAWDKDFVKVDQSMLLELMSAANYLNIQALLDLTCRTVANIIKDKPIEEIREFFHIENDFTPEEEEKIRKENEWAFDYDSD